jgi:hypothetical protein
MTPPNSLPVATILWRRKMLFCGILLAGIVLSVIVALVLHQNYVGTATILEVAEPPQSTNSQVPMTATKPLLSDDLPTLATSATVLTRLEKDLKTDEDWIWFRARIKAKVTTDSNVMPVTFKSDTPEGAIRGVNDLADEITRFYREIATKRFDSLIVDLRRQSTTRAAQLASYDAQLQSAAREYPYIDVESDGAGTNQAVSVYERLIALRAQRDETVAAMRSDAALASQYGLGVKQAEPLALRDILNTDVVYRDVWGRYGADNADLQHTTSFARAGYPGLDELQRTVAAERQAVAVARSRVVAAGPSSDANYVAAEAALVKADGQYDSDQARLASIDGTIGSLEQQVGAGGIAARVARLRRDRQNAQTAYGVLAATLAQTLADRAQAASTGSVVVIDHASFAEPALFTARTFVLVGLGIMTLWAAVSITLLVDRTRRRFYDESSIRDIYGIPVIGALAR